MGVLRLAIVIALSVVPALAYAGATCTVGGANVTIQEVLVSPKGDKPFKLGLREIPVRATLPSRCGAPLTLFVLGSIELEAKRSNVWMRVKRDVTSSDGLVTLQRGAQVLDACIVNGHVQVTAVTYADDVLEGEDKAPDEAVTGVEIPCDALTLDTIDDENDQKLGTATGTSPPGDAEPPDHYWNLRGEATQVLLRSKPDTRSSGRRLQAPSCAGCITLRSIDSALAAGVLRAPAKPGPAIKAKRGWIFVEAFGEGVSARGWVESSRLKLIPETTGVGRSYGCSGGHGGGGWGESRAPGSIERWGTVRAGTRVSTSEGDGEWGTFVRAEHIRVLTTPGSAWAELRSVPGLDGSPVGSPWYNGSIPVAAITFDP